MRRRYRYTILQQVARPALLRARAWWLREPLDCAAMTAAAAGWLGEHDFSAFRAASCQAKSPMRRLIAVEIGERRRAGSTVVTLEFTANAFLHHMVRNFVGTLAAVGSGELAAEEAVAILEQFVAAEEVEVVHLTPRLFAQGLALYKSHQDKAWGLVDCISFIVMREAGVTQALTFDQHFVQASFQALMREIPCT